MLLSTIFSILLATFPTRHAGAAILVTNNAKINAARMNSIKIPFLKLQQAEVVFLMLIDEKESKRWVYSAKVIDFYHINDHRYEHFWAIKIAPQRQE